MPSLEDFAQRMEQYFVDEESRSGHHPLAAVQCSRGTSNTHDAVVTAVKRLREKGNPIRLVYGETFEDLVGFLPQAYFTLNPEEVTQWYDAMKEYAVFRGEVNDFPYQQYYPTIGKVRQIESNNSGYTVAYMYASLIEPQLW